MARKRTWLNGMIIVLLLAPALLLTGPPTAETNMLVNPTADTPYLVQDFWGDLAPNPLSFEPNQSYAGVPVNFVLRGGSYSLLVTCEEAHVPLSPHGRSVQKMPLFRDLGDSLIGVILHPSIGPILKPKVTGLDERPESIYYAGTNVLHYARVQCHDIYRGIDLIYHANQGNLELDFVVSPGADPTALRLGLGSNDQSNFIGPVIYQEINGVRQGVSGGYLLQAPATLWPRGTRPRSGALPEGGWLDTAKTLGFHVAAYDTTLPLVIHYSTDLGGKVNPVPHAANDIAVDAAGNLYLAGNGLVTKLSPAGAPVYRTFGLGDGRAIAVDADGNVYMTGRGGIQRAQGLQHNPSFPWLSTDWLKPLLDEITGRWPREDGTVQDPLWDGRGGAFVVRLDAEGERVYHSVLLGDVGRGIALDAKGNTYVATGCGEVVIRGERLGCSMVVQVSPNNSLLNVVRRFLPTDAITKSMTASPEGIAFYTANVCSDGFVSCATYVYGQNPDSQGLYFQRWTQLRGASEDIAVDASGHVYVVGRIHSCDLRAVNAFQPQCGRSGGDASADAFVVKLDPRSGQIIYSTYLGGDGDDFGTSIAVDAEGNAYVTGITKIPAKRASPPIDFPTEKPWQAEHGGGSDVFVAKLSPEGALEYSTFLGGPGDDVAQAITLDAEGNFYVLGTTESGFLPLKESSASTRDADIPITGTGAPESLMAGSEMSYDITVSNNGPLDATGIVVTVKLPVGATLVSVNLTQGDCSESDGILECGLGQIADGDTVTVAVQVAIDPSATGIITTTASVTGEEADPDDTNNVAGWEVLVAAPPTPAPTAMPAPTAAPTPTSVMAATPTPSSTATPPPTTPPEPTSTPVATLSPSPTAPPSAVPTLIPKMIPTPTPRPTPVPTSTDAPTLLPTATASVDQPTEIGSLTVVAPTPPVATSTRQPPPTTAPPAGGGCSAQAGGNKAVDGVWIIFGLGLTGLIIARSRRRRLD